jgi:hypothetical protein
MTPNTAWCECEHSVVKVTDYNYDENINPSWSTISIEYPKVAEALNLGDIIVISTKTGKGVEVGQIVNIEKSIINTNTVITVIAPTDIDEWGGDFIDELKIHGQSLFVIGPDEFNHPVRRLSVELSLSPEHDPNPPFINVPNFHEALDGNGDNTITVTEVEAFVKKAKARIARPEGLTFAQVAEKIPPGLKVSGVELSGTGTNAEEKRMFNDLAAQVKVVDGKQFVYFQYTEEAPLGIGVNRFGDIDRIDFDDWMNNIRAILRPYTYGPQADVQPWALSSIYIKLVDKVGETVVVKDELIKSIKRVKKCGKRYYKLELEDRGFVSNVLPGKYEDCLAFIGVNPVDWIREDPVNC